MITWKKKCYSAKIKGKREQIAKNKGNKTKRSKSFINKQMTAREAYEDKTGVNNKQTRKNMNLICKLKYHKIPKDQM